MTVVFTLLYFSFFFSCLSFLLLYEALFHIKNILSFWVFFSYFLFQQAYFLRSFLHSIDTSSFFFHSFFSSQHSEFHRFKHFSLKKYENILIFSLYYFYLYLLQILRFQTIISLVLSVKKMSFIPSKKELESGSKSPYIRLKI